MCIGYCGRNIADRLQQAPVIEPIYLFQGGKFHGLEASPRPAPMNQQRVVKPVDSLGKLADFVVLSGNPMTTDPERLAELKVVETIQKGVSVYRA